VRRGRSRFFSLIEVLIALGLVTIALPLLTLPFIYSMKNYAEINKSLEYEKYAQQVVTRLFIEMHQGSVPLSQLKEKRQFEVPPDWGLGKAVYEFRMLEEEEPDKPQLWEAKLLLGVSPLPFNYHFIFIPPK
jgi:type II secretory pathway pseudopilin PulG